MRSVKKILVVAMNFVRRGEKITTHSLVEIYLKSPSLKKQAILLGIIYFLTIEYRGVSIDLNNENMSILRAFNEIQHKVSSQAISEMHSRPRYPDNIFFQILFEIASYNNIDSILARVLDEIIETQLMVL